MEPEGAQQNRREEPGEDDYQHGGGLSRFLQNTSLAHGIKRAMDGVHV